MARRRPEFEPGLAGAEAAKLKKFSDAGGSQIQWLSDDARNQFLKLFVYVPLQLKKGEAYASGHRYEALAHYVEPTEKYSEGDCS